MQLDGRASGDPDSDPITYAWTQIGGPAVILTGPASATPSFTAPPVAEPTALTFRLVVSDGELSGDAPMTVTVLNANSPPQCDLARPDPATLWPPDHKLVPVAIAGVSDPDSSDRVTLTITRVTQDEPTGGTGDADTSPDAVVQDGAVNLRAERLQGGNGRVYRVTFTATDGLVVGGACQGTVAITVPSSLGQGGAAIDDGQLYDATR